MDFKNETERKVLGQLIGGHVWENIQKKGVELNIELVKSSEQTYAVYNSGVHTGAFISAFFVNPEEAKQLGWKIKGKIENAIDPDNVEIEIKKKRRRKRIKKENNKN